MVIIGQNSKLALKISVFIVVFTSFFLVFGCAPIIEKVVEAVENNDVELLKEYVAKGSILNSEEVEQQPLEIAIRNENEQIIDLLLEAGADVNWPVGKKKTVLHLAFEKENNELLEKLIDYGADVNIEVERDTFLIQWAALEKKEELLKKIIENRGDIDYQDIKYGLSILHISITEFQIEMIDYLVEKGADLELKTTDGRAPLSYAIFRKELDKAKRLIELGADVRSTGYKGVSPWIELAYYWTEGYLEIADIYYERGMEIEKEGYTALHACGEFGRPEYAMWLLEHGADPNIEDSLGRTPLDLCDDAFWGMDAEKNPDIFERYMKTFDTLIEYGAVDRGIRPNQMESE